MIMSLLAWNENMMIGIESIDNQHQRWIGLINDLHEAMQQGRVVKRLIRHWLPCWITPVYTFLMKKNFYQRILIQDMFSISNYTTGS